MNVAFIPVRGGSKSIPLKNIKMIAGKPLVYWGIKAAEECREIDKIYVSTDSETIKQTVESFGLQRVCVIERDKETATDTASTESAMLEFAQKWEFDNIVLIQATSPLLTADDLSGGFKLFGEAGTDSVLSVVRQKRFIWKLDEKKTATAQNYDIYHRPRRQEMEGYCVENGAFYITSKERLLESQNRISGKIRGYEMDEASYFEIDEPEDWALIEKLLSSRKKKNLHIPDIKMFLTDCDGCLTDGGMYYSETGDELKKFNTLDGMGFQLLRERGIITGIITGEKVELNKRRAEKLHVDILKMGIKSKIDVIRQLSAEYGISLKNIAYVGDDINDLEAIRQVGFGCAVKNGVKEVTDAADYVTMAAGGEGAIREIADLLAGR